ncbi:MAG: carboxypeptidase regulatory-like domain-containing protein [Planctomycetes bacterium]|nr:carboxypeptidase regulatory-like domain-containing protein [Planctomycetota bacterium]
MRKKLTIVTLSLLLLTAAAAAWVVLDPPVAHRAKRPGETCSATTDTGRAAACCAPAPTAAPTKILTNPDADKQAAREAAEQREQGSQPGKAESGSPQTGGAGNGGANNSGGNTPTPPPAKRNPTPSEREEAARQAGGRAAYRSRLEASAPDNGKADAALKKSSKQEEWIKQWKDEGIEPPEMVPTQVTGKVMSQQAREGIAGAVVALLTFFPVNGQPGGQIWPVLTELIADAQGNFAGEVPASPKPPFYYTSAAITVRAESYRVIAGMPLSTFNVGQLNSLGIFWAPENPFSVECDGTQFSGSLEVVCTGQLDPQRWYGPKRGPVLSYFPHFAMSAATEKNPTRSVKVLGNWDDKVPPFMTLTSSGGPLQTKRCVRAKVQSQKSGGEQVNTAEPFDKIVFESSGFAEISGQVVDSQGAGVPNATVIAAGDTENPTELTDSLGFFRFEKPPKKTTLLAAAHDDFITVIQKDVTPGMSSVRIVFKDRKPVLTFHLRDQLTQMDITSVNIKLFQPGKSKTPAPIVKELTSQNGAFYVKSDTLLASITLEKVGYFPLTVLDPVKVQSQQTGEWNIYMNPGRKLEVRPRDHTACQDAARYYSDTQNTQDPGIWTYWSNLWIEYTIDFGAAPEAGVEGGFFDVVLGCRNEGIVDNNYQFQVKVYVDDVEKGTLNVLANTLTEQFGRMSLGQLSGIHRVRLVWLNDSWIPDQLDANIRYQSLKFLEQPGP